MKFVAIPTHFGSSTWVDTGDVVECLVFPVRGERVEDVDTEAADSTVFPKVLPMEQVCKWWHRVRKWEILVDHPYLGGAPVPCTLELDESRTIDEEITLDWPRGWQNVGDVDPLHWPYAGRWTGSFVWEDQLSFEHTAYFTLRLLQKPDNVTFYYAYKLDSDFSRVLPAMSLVGEGDGLDGNGWTVDTSYSGAGWDSTATLSMDGVSIAISATFAGGSGLEHDPMTLTLTPSMYWEYRDADGTNPKWDSLTGELL